METKVLATAYVGSKIYNLIDEKSDTDILVIGEGKFLDIKQTARKSYATQDLHAISSQEYLIGFFLKEKYSQRIEDFFSFSCDDSNIIFEFLRENREDYLNANLYKIYKGFYQKIDNRFTKMHYELSSKTSMTCMRLLHVLKTYAETRNWNKSFWIEEPLRTDLLKIKHKEKSFEQLSEEFFALKYEVDMLQDFYRIPQNEKYNELFYRECCKILEVPFESFIDCILRLPLSRRTEIFDEFLTSTKL